jgi:hypothetical protein
MIATRYIITPLPQCPYLDELDQYFQRIKEEYPEDLEIASIEIKAIESRACTIDLVCFNQNDQSLAVEHLALTLSGLYFGGSILDNGMVSPG